MSTEQQQALDAILRQSASLAGGCWAAALPTGPRNTALPDTKA